MGGRFVFGLIRSGAGFRKGKEGGFDDKRFVVGELFLCLYSPPSSALLYTIILENRRMEKHISPLRTQKAMLTHESNDGAFRGQ